MDNNCQKIKLLRLMELLRQETDEEHPMPTSEICARLTEMGTTCERRTVTRDMEILNKNGYEIMCRMVGHEKGYYIDDRTFSLPELKILIDAVQGASFIPEARTAQMIDKIAQLGGSHRAELLVGNIVRFNTRKHNNDAIYSNIDAVEAALTDEKRLSFYYFDLNENHERVYRKAKRRYIVDPIALVFSEDNYYLMTYSTKYSSIINYRLDRMEDVRTDDAPICPEARDQQIDIGTYTEQVFKMFNGPTQQATLVFSSKLIGAIFDKFGENTIIRRVDDDTCRATVTVSDTPTFYGWLFQFGEDMRMTAPETMIRKFRQMSDNILSAYSDEKIEQSDDLSVL